MGYLLNDNFIIRRRFVIPELDVQQMDSSLPYTLVPTNNSFFAIPVFCNLTAAANQTTPYDVFVHIHLTNTSNYGVGDICATYSQNASAIGVIDNTQYFAMLVNFQSAPNRFGGINGSKDLQIFWDTLPAVGDGDLIVDLGYIIQPI
jgi:hypothetical protein